MHIAIIGSGLSGACITRAFAHFLSKRESISCQNIRPQISKITVFERKNSISQSLSVNASGNPIAVIHPPITKNKFNQKLSEIGIKKTQEWISDLNVSSNKVISNMCGVLHVPKNKQQELMWEKIFNNDKFLKKNSLKKNEINNFLKKKNSYSIGVWNESCGWISPVSFIKACFDDSKKKLKRKLKFITNCKISSIKKKQNKITISTKNNGEITYTETFDIVVIATGSGTPDLIKSNEIMSNFLSKNKSIKNKNLILNNVIGQMTTIEESRNRSAIPKFVFCKGGYITPKINTKIYSGATYENSKNEDPYIIQKNREKNLRRYYEFVSDESSIKNISDRRSSRCISQDRLPIIGKINSPTSLKSSNVYTMTALGSRGFSYAPLLAELLVEDIINDLTYNFHSSESQAYLLNEENYNSKNLIKFIKNLNVSRFSFCE